MTEPMEVAAAGDAGEPAKTFEVRAAVKRYGDFEALSEVSFSVDGGIFGLLGANGAGKSTLFKATVGLIPLDGGEILIDGLDAQRDGLEVRRRLGYLPEDLELYDRLTGLELLELVAGLKGLDDAAERLEWLSFFQLDAAKDQLISGYSLGMRKKIGLASALLGSPRLVLLDEPLNGLDTDSMRRLRLRMEAMAEAGTTFIVSSHVMAFVERVCERIVILKRGRVVAAGTPEALRRGARFDGPFEDLFLSLAVDE
ncbi:MAG: ABC transporter ATP-binding protein [Acidobacteriota bacterium]